MHLPAVGSSVELICRLAKQRVVDPAMLTQGLVTCFTGNTDGDSIVKFAFDTLSSSGASLVSYSVAALALMQVLLSILTPPPCMLPGRIMHCYALPIAHDSHHDHLTNNKHMWLWHEHKQI